MRNPEQTIGNLIDKQNVSFIASISKEGYPNIKAMLPPRKRIGIKEFWFTTNTSSMRVAQYRENPNASVYFYDRRFFRGVMLIGTMEVLQDAETKQMIWLEGDTMLCYEAVTHITNKAQRMNGAESIKPLYWNLKKEMAK